MQAGEHACRQGSTNEERHKKARTLLEGSRLKKFTESVDYSLTMYTSVSAP